MGKTKFIFDKESGTLKPVKDKDELTLSLDKRAISNAKSENDEISIDLNTNKPNIVDENIIQFRENSDYTIFQITNDKTRKIMMIIAGYGLEIKFNMTELRTTENIEQLLNGLTSMFRKMILEQALNKQNG